MIDETIIKAAKRLRKELITLDEPIKAFNFLEALNLPELEKEKLDTFMMIRHIFDKDFYKQYYSENLPENPTPEEFALKAELVHPRFAWILKKLEEEKANTMLDVGCSDGVLSLTVASKGIKT